MDPTRPLGSRAPTVGQHTVTTSSGRVCPGSDGRSARPARAFELTDSMAFGRLDGESIKMVHPSRGSHAWCSGMMRCGQRRDVTAAILTAGELRPGLIGSPDKTRSMSPVWSGLTTTRRRTRRRRSARSASRVNNHADESTGRDDPSSPQSPSGETHNDPGDSLHRAHRRDFGRFAPSEGHSRRGGGAPSSGGGVRSAEQPHVDRS